MQIQSTLNNNYKASFGAQLQLEGAVKDLSKDAAKQIEDVVKKIGNDNDIVSIHIGDRFIKEASAKKEEQLTTIKDIIRNVSVASYIGGRIKQAQLLTNANGSYENDMKNLAQHVIEYLKILEK
jgi:hypothetical protein